MSNRKWLITPIVMVIAAMLISVYGYWIEPNRMVVREFEIEYNGFDAPITIAQISDIHLGDHFSDKQLLPILEEINAIGPDILVFTGDLFDNAQFYEFYDEARDAFLSLDPEIIKIAIFGNHDLGGGGYRIYRDFMKSSGFTVLVNDKMTVEIEGQTIELVGLDDGMLGSPSYDFESMDSGPDTFNMLLVHEPDIYDRYIEFPIQLVLSGHSHGGQISLGNYIAITPPLSRLYKRGLFEIENEAQTKLYVHTGIGNTRIPIRIGNPPEISVFTIK